jgi:flagellar motor switch protein FliG
MMNQAIRKAAILVSTLDRRSADALLDQMPAEQALLIRRAAFELERIDPVEQERVIAEFLGNTPQPQVSPPRIQSPPQAPQRERPRPRSASPFCFLHDTDCRQIVALLEGEHPQTIAVVVSHLPAERAMALVASLPSTLQAEVIRRLVDLDETDPDILAEVEQGLETRIARHLQMQQRRTAGMKAVVNILAAAERDVERQILVNLARHAPELARQLPYSGPAFGFEDLALLDGATLGVLVRQADPEVTILALAGSHAQLVDRVLGSLPTVEAQELRDAWRHLGPTPLSDIEAAQQAIVELAEQLELEGRIELPLATRLRLAPA